MALRNHRLAALALFSALSVLHSWPLASNPAHLARYDNADASLNTWVIAWVSHTLPRNPLALFEAPIFHPEPHTLAYSEHLFVPATMAAPLIWAGVSPVVAHNLLIIAGFALSGWAMYLLMMRWTGSHWAGVIAGLAYAFNAHVLTRFAHVQAQHVEFFPLMLYALDRVLVDGRRRDTLLLAAAFVLQALCSNYLLVFCSFALVIAIAVRGPKLPWRELAIAAAISSALLIPFLWPYYLVSRDQGLVRSVSEVALYSAGWRDYLATGARLHYSLWSEPFLAGRTALFPGGAVMVLSAIAVAHRTTRRDPRLRMALAIAALGVAFSFGTTLPGYAVLHEHVPLLAGIRNAARWGWLALAGGAILAGFGTAVLARKQWRGWPVIATIICLVITAEAIRTPVGYTPFDGIPRIYQRLTNEPDAVVAEIPVYSGSAIAQNGRYVLANTQYFKPLVNGYSGFQPMSFEERGKVLDTFPSEPALKQLRTLGVTHLVVHPRAVEAYLGAAALSAIDRTSAIELLAEENGIRLYRLR